jgi:predicted DNA-binding transcriptional regulator AlpA
MTDNEIVTMDKLPGILQASISTIKKLIHRPGFPKAIRYTPKGRRYYQLDEILKWRNSQRR